MGAGLNGGLTLEIPKTGVETTALRGLGGDGPSAAMSTDSNASDHNVWSSKSAQATSQTKKTSYKNPPVPFPALDGVVADILQLLGYSGHSQVSRRKLCVVHAVVNGKPTSLQQLKPENDT
jgi:hypothetical protein